MNRSQGLGEDEQLDSDESTGEYSHIVRRVEGTFGVDSEGREVSFPDSGRLNVNSFPGPKINTTGSGVNSWCATPLVSTPEDSSVIQGRGGRVSQTMEESTLDEVSEGDVVDMSTDPEDPGERSVSGEAELEKPRPPATNGTVEDDEKDNEEYQPSCLRCGKTCNSKVQLIQHTGSKECNRCAAQLGRNPHIDADRALWISRLPVDWSMAKVEQFLREQLRELFGVEVDGIWFQTGWRCLSAVVTLKNADLRDKVLEEYGTVRGKGAGEVRAEISIVGGLHFLVCDSNGQWKGSQVTKKQAAEIVKKMEGMPETLYDQLVEKEVNPPKLIVEVKAFEQKPPKKKGKSPAKKKRSPRRNDRKRQSKY